jgi:hypothetical protein
MNQFMTELDVISQYPKELSEEMVVLMRRISYLKLMMSQTSESQFKVLDDVSDFSDFIYHLMFTKRTTPFDFVKSFHKYELDSYVERMKDEIHD